MSTKLFLSYCKLTRHSWNVWKKIPIQTCNYSSLPTRFSHIKVDLSNLKDFPQIKNNVYTIIFDIQNKMWEEMLKIQIEFQDNLNKEKEAEKKLLYSQIEKLQQKIKQQEKLLLYIKRMDNIRNALEYIHKQSLKNISSTKSTENNILQHAIQDEKFDKFLQKKCEENKFLYDNVQKCINSVNNTAQKVFYNHEKVLIDAKSWSQDDVLFLGSIFKYYNIPFLYYDNDNELADYPYKL